MLYKEITSAYQFERAMPADRMKNYSYDAQQAMYNYWDERANHEDIEISEELEYPCCEYDSAEQAVNDFGDIDDIYRELVEEYLWDEKDIDIDDVEDWEQYIDELDYDKIMEKAIEFLENHNDVAYVEELSNGNIFVVRNDC